MGKGLSIHLGLNTVDPNHYSGWSGPLNACEADANDIEKIAKNRGFAPTKLLTKDATRANVIAALTEAAGNLGSGDILLLSFSGHGGQVPDLNYDEPDSEDETWCLFDGQLIDDELWELYARFKEGVRILVLSDSCHSGTVVRAPASSFETSSDALRRRAAKSGTGTGLLCRNMPSDVAERVYRDNPDFYIPILEGHSAGHEHSDMAADIRLISGCQDNQLSLDGTFNGLFTGTLLRVWKNGLFTGNYTDFHKSIVARMPPDQTPNHARYGEVSSAFDNETPFTI